MPGKRWTQWMCPQSKWVSISYFRKCLKEPQKSPMKTKLSLGFVTFLLQCDRSYLLSLAFKWNIVKKPRCILLHPTEVLTVKLAHHFSVLRLGDHALIPWAEARGHNLPAGKQESLLDHFRLQSRRKKRKHACVPVPGNALCKFKNHVFFLDKGQFHL